MLYYSCQANVNYLSFLFFFFKQKTEYEMRISDWSSDVCSSDLSVMMCEGNRARSMCSLWKLGSSVVVTACRRPAPRLRVVHVDADTAAIVHHLDAIDAASVGLHALGVDDPA